MPTLKELMETDLGIGEENVKTAAEEQSGDQDIDSLAAQLGLSEKTAEEEEDEEEQEEQEEQEEKKGSDMSVSLYDQLFPEDDVLSKTAEEVKVAEYQEALGARSYDYCAHRFDRRIEKLASEVLTGGATISAPTGDTTAAPHDSPPTPDQQFDNNKPADAGTPIDHTPAITNELPGKNEEKVVGDVEQKKAAIEDAALRKAWLLQNLEQ